VAGIENDGHGILLATAIPPVICSDISLQLAFFKSSLMFLS